MIKKNYDEDIRFKAKQRCQTISEWAFKTIDSERVQYYSLLNTIQEARAKSLYSGAIKIQNQPTYQLHYLPKSIDTVKVEKDIKIYKNLFNLCKLYQCRKNPRLTLSQKPTTQQSSKIYRKLIDPNQITRSLDYSDIADSSINTTKKRAPQNQRLKKQFQAIHNKMKLILDSYNNRERVLLKYIASLQQEIIALKQTYNQTI